jgi:hypothetical protein
MGIKITLYFAFNSLVSIPTSKSKPLASQILITNLAAFLFKTKNPLQTSLILYRNMNDNRRDKNKLPIKWLRENDEMFVNLDPITISALLASKKTY